MVDGGKDKPSHKMVRVLRRHCEFRRQSQVHNALSPTSSEESCTVNLTVPNRTREATAQWAKSQRASCGPGNDSSLLRGIFRRRRGKTDTNSPSVRPVRPSIYPRGVLYLSVEMSCSFIMPGRFLTRLAMRGGEEPVHRLC